MENQVDKRKVLLDYTFVLDASGSMAGDRKEVFGELNIQLQTLKDKFAETGRPCRVTIVKFNSEYFTLRDNEPIESLTLLDRNEYEPGGMTALYDAFGISVTRADARVGLKVRDGAAEAVVVVFTDGQENSSREHTRADVARIFKHYQELPGWDINLIGTDFTTIEEMAENHMRRDKMRHYEMHEKRRAMANLRGSIRDYYIGNQESLMLDKEEPLVDLPDESED